MVKLENLSVTFSKTLVYMGVEKVFPLGEPHPEETLIETV